MKMTRKLLTLEVRQQIWVMKADRVGIREIARRLKIDCSIVSRELRRNCLDARIACRITPLERANEAHAKAKRRLGAKRRGQRKARPLKQVYEHIALKLSEHWSPEMISGTWSEYFQGETLSTSSIYRLIKRDWPELKSYLPERGRKRRARIMQRRGKVQQAAREKVHISERSTAADQRSEIGHLEVDSILSKRGSKVAIVSIIDRMTRKRWFILVKDLQAATVRKALVMFLHTLSPQQRRSLTLDRGSEFAEWDMLEKIFPALKVYFCTAYSPHEKGSVERSNRDFRVFFPKGTDFALIDQHSIKLAENAINNRPMKILQFKTPQQLWNEELKQAA